MAPLPRIIAEPRIPAQGPSTSVDARAIPYLANTGLTNLGEAAQSLAGTVLAAEKHARDANDVSRTVADITQKLDQYRIELEKDPDYAGRAAKFQAKANELWQAAAPNLSNAASYAFQSRFEALYQGQAHAIRTQARQDEIQSQRVDLQDSTDKLLETALNAPNRVARDAALAEIKAAIETARDTGVLSAAAAKAFHKSTLGKFDELTISRVMRTNPGLALKFAGDPAMTPNLDPLRREQLKIQAQARGEQMSALARATASANVAGVIDAFSKGNFQPSNLEEVRQQARAFPKLWEQLNQAEFVYRSAADFAAKDLPAQAETLAAMKRLEAQGHASPTDTALRAGYEKITANLAHAFNADIMATAMQRDPAAAEAYAAATRAGDAPAAKAALMQLVEVQRRNVAPQMTAEQFMADPRLRLLPKPAADAIETSLNGTKDQARIDTINTLKAQYGPELWPHVFRQLDAGKKLPADVKLIASLPLSNEDARTVQAALGFTDKQIAELIPDKDVRGKIKTEVQAGAAEAREALARSPEGGPEQFAFLQAQAGRLADYLLATKRAPSEAAAAKQAWDIVWNKHFAVAGSVAIPRDRLNANPAAGPLLTADMVAKYQDYFKRMVLPGLGLEVPPPGAGTALLPEAVRAEMRRTVLVNQGYWVADGADQGMVMLDGNGAEARDANGTPIRVDWRTIESDARFLDWYRGGRQRDEQRQQREQTYGKPTPAAPRGAPPGGSLAPHQWLLPRAPAPGGR